MESVYEQKEKALIQGNMELVQELVRKEKDLESGLQKEEKKKQKKQKKENDTIRD